MNQVVLSNLLRFVVLLLFQVLVLNYINLGYYLNPFVYIMALLLLPMQIPHWVLMLTALLTGLLVDVFANTLGVHAGSAVLIAFLRPYIVALLTPKSGYEGDERPNIADMGWQWFLFYSGILTLVFHLSYFMLEVFSFSNIHITLMKTLFSSLLAWLLIVMITLLWSGASSGKRR